MFLKTISPPAEEPLTFQEGSVHLHLESGEDDWLTNTVEAMKASIKTSTRQSRTFSGLIELVLYENPKDRI